MSVNLPFSRSRDFARALLLALFALPVFAEPTRPNVLFIAADDLRPELGVYGSRAKTPNIDRLAASGLRFDRAYTAQAVCGASRVALMTGLYPEYTWRALGSCAWLAGAACETSSP